MLRVLVQQVEIGVAAKEMLAGVGREEFCGMEAHKNHVRCRLDKVVESVAVRSTEDGADDVRLADVRLADVRLVDVKNRCSASHYGKHVEGEEVVVVALVVSGLDHKCSTGNDSFDRTSWARSHAAIKHCCCWLPAVVDRWVPLV